MKEYTTLNDLYKAMKEQITGSDTMAVKALQRIYEYQTGYEQKIQGTCMANGIGFTGSDGKILSSMAEWSKKRPLTEKQMKLVKARIGKYARQLVNQSIEKGLIKKENGKYVY